MNFIEKPNLPNKQVQLVAVSSKYKHIVKALNNLGIECVEIPPCTDIDKPVSSHADMLIHHLGYNKIAVYNYSPDLNYNLKFFGFDIIYIDESLKTSYPFDIALNSLRLGDDLFCKKDSTSKKIMEDFDLNIVNVKQGYVKCSCCVVDENSVITTDKSIKTQLEKLKKDVLYIPTNGIILDGYGCGFIGGCTGKISRHDLVFTGSLKKYLYKNEIENFLKQKSINTIELCEGAMLDIGSIIPLKY